MTNERNKVSRITFSELMSVSKKIRQFAVVIRVSNLVVPLSRDKNISLLWQYGLWSFQMGYTKLERFLHKNQHTQRKLLNFENWTNGEPQQLAKIRVCKVDFFILPLFLVPKLRSVHSWRRRQSYFFFVSQFMAFKYSLIYIKINGISQNHSPLPFHIQNSSFFQVVLLQLSDLSQKQQ